MSAATFVLAISLFVAFTFATTFGVASLYARNSTSARWLAFGYGLGMFNPLLEILLPMQADPRLIQIVIPLTLQYAAALGVVALARHYRLTPPWRTLALFFVGALVLNIAIVDLDRGTALRNTLYQSPFFIIHVLGVITILRFRQRQALDNALVSLFALSAVQFALKPLLAVTMGNGATAGAYIGSTYAAVSQSVGSMLLIATGLMLLLIIMRDVLAETTARSETDTLSGLLNRRGFEAAAERLIAGGSSCAVIMADLDHFKSINDSFGHAAGDGVIIAFARLLARQAGDNTIVSRLGGEEFVALVPQSTKASALDYADTVRQLFSQLRVDAIHYRPVSASFGIAMLEPGDTLSDALRRADAALYTAKKNGRNRVCQAESQTQKSPAGASQQGLRLVSDIRTAPRRSAP